MSVERCSICERDVDTDFEEGVYILEKSIAPDGRTLGSIWICDNCDEGE